MRASTRLRKSGVRGQHRQSGGLQSPHGVGFGATAHSIEAAPLPEMDVRLLRRLPLPRQPLRLGVSLPPTYLAGMCAAMKASARASASCAAFSS
jgi:hypothetical protein